MGAATQRFTDSRFFGDRAVTFNFVTDFGRFFKGFGKTFLAEFCVGAFFFLTVATERQS